MNISHYSSNKIIFELLGLGTRDAAVSKAGWEPELLWTSRSPGGDVFGGQTDSTCKLISDSAKCREKIKLV